MNRPLRALGSHFLRHAAAYAVLSIGFALTVAAHEYVAGNLRVASARAFDEESDDVISKLRRRLDTSMTLALAARAQFAATSEPRVGEFETFARSMATPEHAPGMHGLGFAMFSEVAPPAALIATPAIGDEPSGEVGVDRERLDQHPAASRAVYVELGAHARASRAERWIEGVPFERAIEIARDEGRPAATSRVEIDRCREGGSAPGFVIYLPVYAPGDVATVDARRTRMRGVVFATFCSPGLLSGLLNARAQRSLDFEIYDSADIRPSSLLADSDLSVHAEDEDDQRGIHFLRTVPFEVAGRPWTLHFAQLEAADTSRGLLPPLVTFGGIMLSILLAGIVWAQGRARNIAEAGERRTQILANASRVFTAYADESEAIHEVARLTVPHVCDWCAISLFEGDQHEFYCFGFMDPGPEEQAMCDACFTRPASSLAITGQTELIADTRALESTASIPENVLRGFGARSVVRAPMMRQGELLGMVTLVVVRPLRRLGANEVLLAAELARIIVTAVDGARLYRRTQEASRLKDEFLATLSHELRTPLNAILGWAHLLRSTTLEDVTRQRAVETIERNARQQAQIVSDLLDVSRIILGQINLDRAPVDLRDIMQEALEAQHVAAQAKRIEMVATIEPQPLMVLGDRARLQQVVWNLMSNAIKFTPNEGRVEITLERETEFVVIRVADTGQGLSAEFLPHIFERFRQADASSTRAHGGLGLGLAIVRHLVELHGGTVSAASAGLGRGAVFEAKIPAAAKSVATLDAVKRDAERRDKGGKQQAG